MMQSYHLIQAEITKLIRIERSYWVSLLADQLFFVLGFLIVTGVFDLVTDGNFDRWARLSALIGYLTWRVAGGCMAETAVSVADDAQFGTLEQVWMSGESVSLILFARSCTFILYYTLRVILMALIIMPLLRIPVIIMPGSIVIYLLTVGSAFGLAFAITGLHLITKNVESITMPLATALLFFSGALSSLEGIPILYQASRFLPLSIGIDLLRKMLVEGADFWQIAVSSDFYSLVVNTAVYLIIGLFILKWAGNKARHAGTLGHY
ncbi:MAG: hypothetical protein DWQ04_10110 [Chloroflexi bacterium]|nr:MAG: hypothetical protein DWQ04_10110 [Chloroflexota bacterium]